MKDLKEEEILDLYFSRSDDALRITEKVYGGRLLRFASNMICNEDAMECVNDTYLAAWNMIPPERPHNFLSWLYKVLRNIVCDRIDWNTAAKRGKRVNVLLDELAECISDSNASYEGELSDTGRIISDFLNNIDKDKRIMFVRRYWYGLSISELSKEYAVSQSKIKTTLFRIRKELKEYLIKEGVYYG